MRDITTYTRQEHLRDIPMMWKKQYGKYFGLNKDRKDTYENLVALKNPKAEDINKIIGNETWTRFTCDVCNEEAESLASIGHPHSEEYGDLMICLPCLLNAADKVIQSLGEE